MLQVSIKDTSEAELAKKPLNFEIFRKEHGERYERKHILRRKRLV